MSDESISNTEISILASAIEKIISSEVLEKELDAQLPLTEDLQDSNKVYCGRVSILFVDMRESTKLPEKFSSDQLVKIYRSYIRTVVQAIRYSGGVVRDFMGDGVLAVFVDDASGKSEDKSVHAARYITTAIDKVLNPRLDKEMKHRISCGIGIYSGEISISKVGMKGKGQNDGAENEFGIAWIGNCTNLACKFSSAVGNGAIFISTSTYANLSNLDEKQCWDRHEIIKGNNVLNGYIAQQHYLSFINDVPPCTAGKVQAFQSLNEAIAAQFDIQCAEIRRRLEELVKKEQSLLVHEKELSDKLTAITQKEKILDSREFLLWERDYFHYKRVISESFLKKTYILHMGEAFWDEQLKNALETGSKIGKSSAAVKQEICYYMVDIYVIFDAWSSAYDYLVEQATGGSWLNLSVVQNVVNHTGYCDRLLKSVQERIYTGDLDSDDQADFEKIEYWLKHEFKK